MPDRDSVTPEDPPSARDPGNEPPASGRARRSAALDDLLSIVSPETAESGRSPGWKAKRVAFIVVAAAVAGALTIYVTAEMDLIFTEERAATEDRATDAIDDKKPPFDWKIMPAVDGDEGWFAFHLDRYLTAEERARLKATRGDGKKIWSIVRPWGARRVGGRADGYLAQFTSERAKPVSITKLLAKPTQCRPSKVKTVISTSGAGAVTWGDIHFFFNNGAKAKEAVPAMEKGIPGAPIEDTPQWNKVISLGNGESPGYFKLWPQSQLACEWTLTAEYNVSSGKTQQVLISEDEHGKKLLTIGENPQDGVDYMTPNEFEAGG
ncbi:hypothetical protein ACH4SP_04415 [Streptomyces sp. NPDC021093]|uniref:hypothetical protein n=1 Tax=Streptomyces sp. NPDC021093 TaxID=3365112 RepID=UPI0037A071EF